MRPARSMPYGICRGTEQRQNQSGSCCTSDDNVKDMPRQNHAFQFKKRYRAAAELVRVMLYNW